MSDNSGIDIIYRFFPGTGITYDRIVNLCTFGFDGWWKKKMLEKIPAGSTQILDQACGTGILTFKIAKMLPCSQITGVDMTSEYLQIAKAKAENLNLANIKFILGRAEDVLLKQSVDCITSSYLAKYAELDILIPNIQKMLRSGGILVMHDFTYPEHQPMILLWELYFKLLQTAGAWRFPEWKTAFDGLPELMHRTSWVNDLVNTLQKNNFSDVTVQTLTFHTAAIVTARKG
jgi:demethylmenaquinone methyltransferase/2-methoxy-6-polyprenyl-1,4-benzoquinol methylase